MSYPQRSPYSLPATRPSVLGALAVAGIVVSVLSAVASLITAAYAVGLYQASAAARDRVLRNAPAALPSAKAGEAVLLTIPLATPMGSRGMDPARRAATIDAIGPKIQLTPEQSPQLDAVLAEAGEEIFQTRDPLSEIGERVGHLPAAGDDGIDPIFFETPAGRVELYGNRAAFHRAGTIHAVRVTAGRQLNADGCPILLQTDARSLIDLIQSSCAGKLNSPQMIAIQSLLTDPAQHLVALNRSPDGGFQVGIQSASVRPDRYASVDFAGGPLLLDPDGKVILQADRSAVAVVDGRACVLAGIEGIASVVAAVFLVIGSIGLLRRPRQPLKNLLIYAAVKSALALLAGISIGWVLHSYFRSYSATTRHAAMPASVAMGTAVVIAVVGGLFPLGVVVVSRARSVREYYRPTA